MRLNPTLAVLLLAVAAGGGCDDAEHIDVQTTTLVRVRDVDGDRPAAGVKIVLMRASANVPLAEPRLSDENGICEFAVVPTGDRAVLAFGAGRWRVFGAPGFAGDVKTGGDPLAPSPPVHADPLVRVAAIPAPAGAHINGTVVDADTGKPLASVFLSETPYPDAYHGNIGPSDDVTLADGAFRVSRIRFLVDPQSGRLTQAVPLWVTRHGYRPRLWRYAPAPGEDIDEIVGVRIELTRETDGARGALRGRLLRGGRPASRVVVGLGWAERPADKAGAGMTGWTARSDQDGVFVFPELPVGRYVLHPGFLPEDGAFYPDQPANFPREVLAGEQTDAGDFQLLWELRAETPRSGARVSAVTRDFHWTPAPDAAAYEFQLDGADPIRVAEPRHELPPDAVLLPGNHTWYVLAVDAQGWFVGTFPGLAEFHVPPVAAD